MINNVVNVLRLGESEGSTSVVAENGATEKQGRGTEVFNVETGSEGGLEGDDEGVISTDENGVVDVYGEDVDETFDGDGEEGKFYNGLGEAERDEPADEEGFPSTGSFTDAIAGL